MLATPARRLVAALAVTQTVGYGTLLAVTIVAGFASSLFLPLIVRQPL